MTKSVSVIVRPKLVRAAPISYSSKYCSTIIAGLHQGGVGAEPGGGAFVGENTAIDADRAPRQRQRRAVGRTHLLRRLERGKRRIGGKVRPIVDRRRPDARRVEPVEPIAGRLRCGMIQIGSAHVRTPVTNSQLLCRLHPEKKKQ